MKTWWRDRIAHLITIIIGVSICLIAYYFLFDQHIQAQINQKADTLTLKVMVLTKYDDIISGINDLKTMQLDLNKKLDSIENVKKTRRY